MYFVWYDNNPKKAVTDKIDEAVLRYKQKFGKAPNICKLNEKMEQPVAVGSKEALVAGVRVQAAKHIPQNYFWLGREA